MPEFPPTAEQRNAVDLFLSGKSLAIEAGAGTGKTSTLELIGAATVGRVGRYIAFNKSIAREASLRFPRHVNCSTAHSLAYRSVGHQFRRRLDGPRMRSEETAKRLGIREIEVTFDGIRKVLAPGFLAGQVMAAVDRFCQSADREVTTRHFGYIDGIDSVAAGGLRSWDNNREVHRLLLPAARKAWADLDDPDGQLNYGHGHYLKTWHLLGPEIPCNFLMFDESQDANPVMLDIVRQQGARGVQLVFVGDSQQGIYEFTGAVNALATVPADARAFLTQSFRFGPAIAEQANAMLTLLDAELRLKGLASIDSVVEPVERPDAILCRTNATAVETVLRSQREGRRVHLVGGNGEILRFVEAADDLKQRGRTSYSNLACFESWGEVQAYVENDPQGADLRMLVGLVDDYGVDQIRACLSASCSEQNAQLVVSTAHKAKGREWSSVQLAGDFYTDSTADAELRLLYVAATRAQHRLDVSYCPIFRPPAPTAPQPVADAWIDALGD